jgi:hypothetical protein
MGDYLSRHYSGTDSTISRVTRDGKEGLYGKIDHKSKVFQRYLINCFSVNPMQTCIDIVLGKYITTTVSSDLQDFIDKGLTEMQSRLSKVDQLRVINISWDLKGGKIDLEKFEKWLSESGNLQQVYIFNFQNIVSASLFGSS